MRRILSKKFQLAEHLNWYTELQQDNKNRMQTALFVFALFVVLLVQAWSLARYPAPHVDEAWLVSRAWGFIQTGHPFGMLDSGLTEQLDHYWIGNQWLITALHSLVLRFFKAPLLLPIRFFSLLVGVGLLVDNYVIAYRLLKTRGMAMLSTLLLATSYAFSYSAHLARYDILAVFFIYTALALVLVDRKGRFVVGLIAGLFTGLAVETHLNSLIYLPAIGVCYLFEYGWQVWKKGTCWGYALGCLIGLAYYLGLHYFPSPATYNILAPLSFGRLHTPPLLTWNVKMIAEEIPGIIYLLLFSGALMMILPLFAIPTLIKKRDKEASLIFVVGMIIVILAWLIYPTKFDHYAIYVAPPFLLMVSFFLSVFLMKPWSGNLWGYIERVFVWGAVVGSIAMSLSYLTIDKYSQYQMNQDLVNSVIKPTDVVMGPQYFWFGLYGNRYLSWETLFLYPHLHPGATLADSFENLKPTIFIFDTQVQKFTYDEIDPSSKYYDYYLPEKELMEYLNQNADLIIDEKGKSDSILRVYRIKQ